ncbi:ArgS-related anticodon-binding protein NrtL [Streptomyces sp. TS71-3]|uniref:ArgS-related anticodon-binding protein NrtL n=1 Tax=Streptomyces sp. TS71-3 TaxID=2733862 RepID=UPI001B113628|nr:DALR anticodon-binding domain-containing protein [Streptomyces sp. TS71-3]GHJ36044.1 hypothetical protein Sm713_16530 [Streptomyces sp. TS71-3]
MTPVELSRTVLHAVRCAVDAGELSVAVPAKALVERPRPGGCGDYATGIALQLARPSGQAPRQIAEVLRDRLLVVPGVAGVEITGPGFLNITLDGDGLSGLVRDVLRGGSSYGHVDERVPAGPLAHDRPVSVRLQVAPGPRAAVLADALARILRSQGVSVLLRYEDAAGPDPAWGALSVPPYDPLSGDHIENIDYIDEDDGPGHDADLASASVLLVRPVPAPADPLPLGRAAGRWALLYPAAHDRPRIAEDHLVQRESNPLFRVRYAHARTRALVRNAAALGFTSEPGDLGPAPALTPEATAGDPSATLTDPPTTPLVTALSTYPQALATAARRRAPDVLARHLVRTADAYLAYQGSVRILPVGDEKPSAAHRARLALAEAAGTVLAGGLDLLGIDAPDTI